MKNYILYGTGWYAEQFLYNFKEKGKIAYCIDGIKTGTFHGFSIYTLRDAPNIENYKIIVTAVWENYIEIKKRLKEIGLTEFREYIWADAFDKKIVVINANCHGEFYKRYLYQSKSFTDEYIIWDVPALHVQKDTCISEDLLKACDLFIHQDIRADNHVGYKFSDEYILPLLKKGCRTIVVPNMVGMGKWNFPTAVRKEYRYGTWAMFCRDSVLDDAYSKYKNVKDIKKYVSSPDVYPEEKVRELFEACKIRLEEREKNWDVKISDYIFKNYQTEKLFYDYDHASDSVMQEIGRRLCDMLGIRDISGKLIYPLNWESRLPFLMLKRHWEYSMRRHISGKPERKSLFLTGRRWIWKSISGSMSGGFTEIILSEKVHREGTD